MGPAAASHYTSKEGSLGKKQLPKKPAFLTPVEQEECKWCEECKKWLVHHQKESIGERYTFLKRQVHRYTQEIQALRFFQSDDIDLACQVLAIADWVEEHNQLSPHPIPEIPAALLAPYSGSLQARGQFPLPPPAEEIGATDVRTQSQAMWIFLCSILQYYEDDMAAREGALYGGKTHRPSAFVLYIMVHVNLGLPEHYRVQWSNIVGKTPWLAARAHLSPDEFCHFYQEPGPDNLSELEQATEDVYHQQVKDAAQREVGDHPLPPSRAETRNPPGPQPPSHEDKPSPQPPEQEDWPHKFQPGPDWQMVTPSKTGSSTEGAQPAGTLPGLDPLDQKLGKDQVTDVLGDYVEEQQTAIKTPIHDNPGLTGSESPEAMEVDPQPPLESAAETPLESVTKPPPESVANTQDQAMETEPTESSPGTFQPELGTPGYTPSLIGSAHLLPSPIMAEDNALLDADPDAPGLAQSKAPGAGRLEGSPKSKMTLQKRKQP